MTNKKNIRDFFGLTKRFDIDYNLSKIYLKLTGQKDRKLKNIVLFLIFLSTSYEHNTMQKTSFIVSENKEFKTWEHKRIHADIPQNRYCVNFCVLIDFY